jgi:hypothetical protein
VEPEVVGVEVMGREAEEFGEEVIREGVAVAGPAAATLPEPIRVFLPTEVSGMAVTSGAVTEATGRW